MGSRISTYSHLCSQVKRLVFSSHPGSDLRWNPEEKALCVTWKGEMPKDREGPSPLLRAWLDPRPTEHSTCPSSFHSILGPSMTCLFRMLWERLQHQSTRLAICKHSPSHWGTDCEGCEMLVFTYLYPDPSTGYILVGNTLRCSSVTSTPGGGSECRKATTKAADHGKMICHPQWQNLGQHPKDLVRPMHSISPQTDSQQLHSPGSNLQDRGLL